MTGHRESVLVAGLPLPMALVAAIQDGRWHVPRDLAQLEAVFKERPTQPQFYSIEGMISETEQWRAEAEQETLEWYLGVPSELERPGDISQTESVIVGDLGPDRPFALDYRRSLESPKVVYLTTYGGWLEVAPNIGTLLDLLGLDH